MVRFEEINRPGWIEQFWSKVTVSLKDNCWEWSGTKYHGKYGYFKGRVRHPQSNQLLTLSAHRYSYLLHNKEMPLDLFVCHHCDNPGCVNPNHLYLGSCQRNTQDACTRGLIGHAKGSKHGRAKLNENHVENIYKFFYQDKKSKRQIAVLLNVSYCTIDDILRGYRWKHLFNELTNKYKITARV
jgi:hypothetical protein